VGSKKSTVMKPRSMSGSGGMSFSPVGPPKGSLKRFQISRMTSPAANEPMRK
jgi:hypothetical protein